MNDKIIILNGKIYKNLYVEKTDNISDKKIIELIEMKHNVKVIKINNQFYYLMLN